MRSKPTIRKKNGVAPPPPQSKPIVEEAVKVAPVVAPKVVPVISAIQPLCTTTLPTYQTLPKLTF